MGMLIIFPDLSYLAMHKILSIDFFQVTQLRLDCQEDQVVRLNIYLNLVSLNLI